MKTLNKRKFIKYSLFGFISSSILWLTKVIADWPANVFNSKSFDEVINGLTNGTATETSEKINIKAPEIAENGAVVPITVDVDLPNISSIAILVMNNPSPLTSIFKLTDQLLPFVSTRVKMAETSDIFAIVENKQGQYFTANRNIKVTIGGCGG